MVVVMKFPDPTYLELTAMFSVVAFTLAGFTIAPECFFGTLAVLGTWVCAIWVVRGFRL